MEMIAGQITKLNRREFLYYIWGASLALLSAEGLGAIWWYAFHSDTPSKKVLRLDINQFREPDQPPKIYYPAVAVVHIGEKSASEPRLHKIKRTVTGRGIAVLRAVCTHLGCVIGWGSASERFECPCHGAKFLASGVVYGNPAKYDLSQFHFWFEDAYERKLTETMHRDFAPLQALPIPAGAETLVIDTSRYFMGEFHPETEKRLD
ncbi:MAG TPA: Rieske 2Fe-2S domain-containing protein [Anaerolineales bacterium]|nr:Rieske 2Fe-2S domain-containing protein [Anaerolineales bacterium]